MRSGRKTMSRVSPVGIGSTSNVASSGAGHKSIISRPAPSKSAPDRTFTTLSRIWASRPPRSCRPAAASARGTLTAASGTGVAGQVQPSAAIRVIERPTKLSSSSWASPASRCRRTWLPVKRGAGLTGSSKVRPKGPSTAKVTLRDGSAVIPASRNRGSGPTSLRRPVKASVAPFSEMARVRIVRTSARMRSARPSWAIGGSSRMASKGGAASGRLATPTEPPCSRATPRTIVRPRPMPANPPSFGGTRKNRSNMRSMYGDGMPGP